MRGLISLTSIHKADSAQRIIEGIASAPTIDRMGDIVEPMGARFKLPLPLLWQHDHSAPIGNVEHARATKEGITFRARIATISTPGKLKDRVDEAWDSIASGLVRATSVGFMALKSEPLPNGGRRFVEWAWHELSCVTIPACEEATLAVAKHYDEQARRLRYANTRVVRLGDSDLRAAGLPPRPGIVRVG